MARKNQEIMILDILRKSPGAGVQDLAEKVRAEPETVWGILNDPDFKAHLINTKGAHVSHLQTLHRIAMERLTECISEQKDMKKVEELCKWVLKYATDSIVRVTEVNQEAMQNQGDGGITINQMLGRDPFANGAKK